jgi:hypothetical protein
MASVTLLGQLLVANIYGEARPVKHKTLSTLSRNMGSEWKF